MVIDVTGMTQFAAVVALLTTPKYMYVQDGASTPNIIGVLVLSSAAFPFVARFPTAGVSVSTFTGTYSAAVRVDAIRELGA